MIQIREISYNLVKPVVTAKEVITERKGYSIRIEEEGHYGEGEVLPLIGWSKISGLEAKEELLAFTSGKLRSAKLSNEVRAGVGMAHWNLKAEHMNIPLWSLLGGAAGSIQVNALVGGVNEKELRKTLQTLQQQGSSVFKIKLGFHDDLERIRVLAEMLRKKEKIRLDPNGAWSLETAITNMEFANNLLGDRLEYVEDPVGTIGQLTELREIVSVPIGTDDLTRDVENREIAFQEKLMDYIVVKPPFVGGIDDTLRISNHARNKGIQVVVSSTYDGPVGLRTWCHLATCLSPNIAHGLGTAMFIEDDQMKSLVPEGGKIHLRE
ncbi:MAG: enolase C-terminal domain-like protein [Acidimicrobiales bacterium]|jgi:O-succinylbenzoate synthase|nr:enolase C-terminal domain-like protein [Acidimicrobiales bacterium]HJM28465.1 enolase C-terminal domain-like protein [Acidimicrobiales bacterium]